MAAGAGEHAVEEAAAEDTSDEVAPPEQLQPTVPDLPSGNPAPDNGNQGENDSASSEGAAVSVEGCGVSLTAGQGGLADFDVDLSLSGVGTTIDELVDGGVDIDGLVSGTVEEALNETLDAVEDVLSGDGLVDELAETATDVVDEALEAVSELAEGLGAGDAGLDLAPALDLGNALNLGGGNDDTDDRDLVVDVSQNLIDLPLVDTPLEADLDAIEDLVGDVDVGVDLSLGEPDLPVDGIEPDRAVDRVVDELGEVKH